MSVTFTAEIGPATGFAFACAGHRNHEVDGTTAHRFGSHQDAADTLAAERDANGGFTGHLAVCGNSTCADMDMYVLRLEDNASPEVNVSNRNAKHVLSVLGFGEVAPDALYGGVSASDMLGRILMAEAVNPSDEGTATTVDGGEGTATVVDCGRHEGYTEDFLASLRSVVEFAAQHGREVVWS